MTVALDPGFTTEALSAVFDPAGRVRAMSAVEGALASASAAAGVVPAAVAERIAAACVEGIEDPEAVLAEGWEAGTPVLPLLARLRERLDAEAAAWLHHGTTTQDVIDTGLVLQVRAALAAVRADLVAVARGLAVIAAAQRDEPTTAFTLLQPAGQTTIGRRAAGWLGPVVGHLADLRAVAGALPVQLGGARGGLDVLGATADEVVAGTAAALGLVVPVVPWHADRTPLLRVMALVQQLTRTTAKVAGDLVLLAHHGTATMRAGGSSAMPGKRNPVDAIRAIAAANVAGGAAGIVVGGRPPELERGAGGWQAEWVAVPLALQAAGAAVEALARAVASLELTGARLSGAPLPGAPLPGAPLASGGAETLPTPADAAAIDRVLAACAEEVAR